MAVVAGVGCGCAEVFCGWPFLLKNFPSRPLLDEDDDDEEVEEPSSLKLLVVPPDEVESEVAYSLFLQFCLIQFLRISVIWNCRPNCSACARVVVCRACRVGVSCVCVVRVVLVCRAVNEGGLLRTKVLLRCTLGFWSISKVGGEGEARYSSPK